MTATEIQQWVQIEREANAIEQGRTLAAAEIPLVTITVENRLRGAIIEAISQIEAGQGGRGYVILKDALKIAPGPS